jgi:hypothetical protein
MAAAAIAPAAIAGHDTAGLSSTGVEISTDSKTIDASSQKILPFGYGQRSKAEREEQARGRSIFL